MQPYRIPSLPLPNDRYQPSADRPPIDDTATVVASVWGRDEYDVDEGDAAGIPWCLLLLLHPTSPHFEVVELTARHSNVESGTAEWTRSHSHGRHMNIVVAARIYEDCGGDL